jgi:hypothetical protein
MDAELLKMSHALVKQTIPSELPLIEAQKSSKAIHVCELNLLKSSEKETFARVC